MDERKVAAQFAAYTWHCEMLANPRVTQAENQRAAHCFAKEHWQSFVPCAHRGLGRLLLRLAQPARRKVQQLAS